MGEIYVAHAVSADLILATRAVAPFRRRGRLSYSDILQSIVVEEAIRTRISLLHYSTM